MNFTANLSVVWNLEFSHSSVFHGVNQSWINHCMFLSLQDFFYYFFLWNAFICLHLLGNISFVHQEYINDCSMKPMYQHFLPTAIVYHGATVWILSVQLSYHNGRLSILINLEMISSHVSWLHADIVIFLWTWASIGWWHFFCNLTHDVDRHVYSRFSCLLLFFVRNHCIYCFCIFFIFLLL